MRDNAKFLRVKDDPVVSVAVPSGDCCIRVFQVADSCASGGIPPIAYPSQMYRFEIPIDNSDGTTPLGVFVNGFFQYHFSVDDPGEVDVDSWVVTFLDGDLATETEQDSLNGTSIMKTTNVPNSEGRDIHDQISFIGGGIALPGEQRLLTVGLYMGNKRGTVLTGYGIGGYLQGFVHENVSLPYPESFAVEEGDQPGDWFTPGHPNAYTSGGNNYATIYSKYTCDNS